MGSWAQAHAIRIALATVFVAAVYDPIAHAQQFPQTPPRPPAPVHTAQDLAAANAVIKRFGFDFVTVGAPGNRSWIESERELPNGITLNHIDDRGRVDYSYRIMRTEVVQTQYVDFVQAFQPFWESIGSIPGRVESGAPSAGQFTSSGISTLGGITVNPAYNDSAVAISWRNAARYANWLHNGAPSDNLTWDTFHTGAYTFTDASFTSHTQGSPVTRNEDARFWLPSLDEYLKAGYYDPNRYGEGEEGYWTFPHGSNEQPVVGPPGEGEWGGMPGDPLWEKLRVGRYPDTQSPWGLLDIVGTEREWVETPSGVFRLSDGTIFVSAQGRVVVGNDTASFGSIDSWDPGASATSAFYAFRLATMVPSPSSLLVLSGMTICAASRRRRDTFPGSNLKN
ncbi:MAG: SUMF1/EgtB/PvdO family nonheme iron enzyme [Phycisphaeraceae bacterium]|nr:SUMF1/EgtB/PvdO family nonheme iron enzyme [Phycisphaeraceae bacterium]